MCRATGGASASHGGRLLAAHREPGLPAHPAHPQHEHRRAEEGHVRGHVDQGRRPPLREHRVQEGRDRHHEARGRAHARRGREDGRDHPEPEAVQDPDVVPEPAEGS